MNLADWPSGPSQTSANSIYLKSLGLATRCDRSARPSSRIPRFLVIIDKGLRPVDGDTAEISQKTAHQDSVLNLHKKYPPIFVGLGSPRLQRRSAWLTRLLEVRGSILVGTPQTLANLEVLYGFEVEVVLVPRGFHRLKPHDGATYFETYRAGSVEEWEADLQQLAARWLAETERRIARLVEALAAGPDDLLSVRAALVALERERARLSRDLADTRARSGPRPATEAAVEATLAAPERLPEILATGDQEDRRRVVRSFLAGVVVDHAKGRRCSAGTACRVSITVRS